MRCSRWQVVLTTLAFCIAAILTACSNGSPDELPSSQEAQARTTDARQLPTLYPTATPFPSPSPAATALPQPTSAPATQAAFDQLVVDVTYSIPLLGLERRIRGNVAGEIDVIDVSAGTSLTLKNRPGVVVEMQQALPKAIIDDPPADCDACVMIDFELPLTGQAGQGWLNDVQVLASLDNYTSVVLGPHFPPGTVVGLRREATPYQVAHSAAITAAGELWTWTATDAQLPEPSSIDGIADQTAADLALIEWDTLPVSIGHACYEGGGRESLQLNSPDGPITVDVRCPELYLPGQLMPIYLALSEGVREQLQEGDVSPPDLPMALDSLALYRRTDGASLQLSSDGRLSAIDAEGVRFTSTLTLTQPLSLTAALLDSGQMELGPTAIFEREPGDLILIRALDGVYELASQADNESIAVLIEPWQELLERVLAGDSDRPAATPEPEPELEPEPTPTEVDDS